MRQQSKKLVDTFLERGIKTLTSLDCGEVKIPRIQLAYKVEPDSSTVWQGAQLSGAASYRVRSQLQPCMLSM
eukprot:5541300-Ditylum_brightwellii.AAC.1